MSIRRAVTIRHRFVGCAAAATLTAACALTGAAPVLASTTAGGPVGGAALASHGLVVDSPGSTPLPKVSGSAWLLADLDTGEVLAAQDPHGRYRPASTLKVLTALTLMPKLDATSTYTAQWEDANAEGSRAGIVPDATYTVDQLWQALFLVSGNDAASALANAAGGRHQTVTAMQQTARDVGALDTTVRNPSGLDADGQLTSAYDLAVIARTAMARQDFRDYVTTVKAQFPGKMPRAGHVRKTFEIFTQDRLLLNYPGAIGIKTGWTTKARGTFVGAATRGGHTLVATVLHSELDSWRDSAALLSWGFKNRSLARPVGTLDALPKAAATAKAEPGRTSTAGTARTAATGATDHAGLGLPWWADLVVLMTVLVALLRARVLLRRRQRRSRYATRRPGGVPRLPQAREPRRVRTPARPAPTAAPSTMPRTVRILPGEPPAEPESAVTGTGS